MANGSKQLAINKKPPRAYVYSGVATSARAPLGVYVAMTIVIFFLTLSAADSIGFVPNYIDGTAPVYENSNEADTAAPSSESLPINQLPVLGGVNDPSVHTALPVRIHIPAINLDLTVQNPATKDIAALDDLLQKGPARYVDSAKLGQKANMIIFAHSSHLPIVHNQMYKAFNRIPELKEGDSITLVGDDGKAYLYNVVEVRKADANEDTIPIVTDGTKLTLVTCDTLTSKSSRFVLTADYVGAIGN